MHEVCTVLESFFLSWIVTVCLAQDVARSEVPFLPETRDKDKLHSVDVSGCHCEPMLR